MSIKKIALTALAAAALAAPTLATADAHHIDKKRDHAIKKHNNFNKFDKYDDFVRAKRKKNHLRHAGNLRTPGIDRRIERQRDRIRNGRRSGDLTWNEARKLRKGLRRIVRARRIAKFDGNVSGYERRDLRDMLNHNGKRIRRLRNNHKTANRHLRKFRKYVDINF